MTLLTAFPLGLVNVIPFPVHGAIELTVAIGLAAAPWIFGFAPVESARLFYVVSGAAVAVVWVLTDYRVASVEARPKAGPAR